ncbi:MAG: chemotaxis-specific protein-glutamate methyltransferase CheB [Chloroflexota bacterium]|nr:chemotaxis-specific protein-glutamate methyltransferase CheB [Chloroflexota bacterium]
MAGPIRVLIVEDSPLASEVLTGILHHAGEIEVIGVARNGVEALAQVPQLKPDLITMDVWMPQMDGFATVEQVMAYYPTPILVITTSLARQDVDISLRMLAAGALDVIEKPARLDEAQWERACRALVQRVKVLARVRVVTHLKGRYLGSAGAAHLAPNLSPNSAPKAGGELTTNPAPAPAPKAGGELTTNPAPNPSPKAGGELTTREPATPFRHEPSTPPRPVSAGPVPGGGPGARGPAAPALPSADSQWGRLDPAATRMAGRRRGNTEPLPPLPPHPPPGSGPPYAVVAIASSTGGPQALLKILQGLPREFQTPILIVQHIAEGFTQGLADWLTREGGRPVRLAVEGERPPPGVVLLAPDGRHLLLNSDGHIALADDAPREIRPSADRMLRSLAITLGDRAVAVILTGMGRDGADGMRAMRLAGAYTIAQDEASSIIFGMPRAAILLGVVDEVLPLDSIAARLVSLVAATPAGGGA